MGGHKVNRGCVGKFGSNHQIALVFAVFMIDENKHLSRTCGGNDLFNRRNRAFQARFQRSGGRVCVVHEGLIACAKGLSRRARF